MITSVRAFAEVCNQLKLNSNIMAHRFQEAGAYVVESEFLAVQYIIHKGNVIIFTASNGVLAFDAENADMLADELTQIAELARERKKMRIKGA